MQARNPVFSSSDNSTIDLEINHPDFGWIPFTATADDVERLGQELYNKAMAGLFGAIAPYDGPTEAGIAADDARMTRDGLLSALDAVVTNPLRWDSFTQEQKDAVASYRQDLLDVPQQDGFPDNIQWPDKPEFIG